MIAVAAVPGDRRGSGFLAVVHYIDGDYSNYFSADVQVRTVAAVPEAVAGPSSTAPRATEVTEVTEGWRARRRGAPPVPSKVTVDIL
ncbi:hypothetical protein [Frankia sp. Cr1]|uniref:hypothetical protein n=1 Tax=Frankia sp. Cr1 TaxID=3073931 RepID=UPI002AD54BBA|nr:hypothetical protein [Frankia sp. Cr1]